MIRRPPRSTRVRSSAASDVYKRQRPPVSEIRDPRSEIWDLGPEIRDQRSRKTSLFTNPTCLPDVLLIRRNSRTHGFYVVPCFPSLSLPTRGSPRLEITRKGSSKSLVKRSFETAAGQKRIRAMARWPGFGGACPTGDLATEPLKEVVLGRRGACWLMFGHYRKSKSPASIP